MGPEPSIHTAGKNKSVTQSQRLSEVQEYSIDYVGSRLPLIDKWLYGDLAAIDI